MIPNEEDVMTYRDHQRDPLLGLKCSQEAKEFSERNWLRFDRQYSQLRDPRDQESMIRIVLAQAFDAGQKARQP